MTKTNRLPKDDIMSNKHNQSRGSSQEDSRLVRDTSIVPPEDDRSSREGADLEREGDEGTALTMEERKALLRREWQADLLPQITDPKGYWHYCWLSTNNSTDPVYRRLKLGYELVKFTEMATLGAQNQITAGEFSGCVSVNEMILARIPNELYNEIMLINHHERPMGEEELLQANAINKMDEEDSEGRPLGQVIGDGLRNLGHRTKTPKFV